MATSRKAWRNQLRDLAILHSLSDDLMLFWQLKANRWELLETRVRQLTEQTAIHKAIDDEEIATKFKKLLLNDPDYKEVRHRIRTAAKETLDIAQFLELPSPECIDELTFKPPLMTNEIIETAIEALDKFIVLCRVSSYPYHYVVQAVKSPRQFITNCWKFYWA